jgi:hypothetical protein
MKRMLLGGAVALALTWAAAAGAMGLTPPREQVWSSDSAFTVPPRRVELGLFGSSHYGLGPRVEVSLHPLAFFALPHLEFKGRVTDYPGRYFDAFKFRVSYPTLFLGLVSREGAGGLLPETSSPPQALQLEADYLMTKAFGLAHFEDIRHTATLSLGLAWAGHGRFSQSELPLLDFPFLYPRFASLYSPVVPRASLSFEGPLWRKLWYEASATYYLMPDLPDVGNAYALEPAAQLEYRFSDRIAVSLGLRTSLAKYGYGTAFHLLPYADVRVGF